METDSTTIRIQRETWQRLHDRKGPGESHDDVIADLLDQAEAESTHEPSQ